MSYFRILGSSMLVLSVLAAGPPSGSRAQQSGVLARPLLRISSVQAKLFFAETGTFSDDVLDNPKYVLWNTPIGEGSAGSPSDATLVVVEIAGGTPGAAEHDRQLNFIANYRFGSENAKGVARVRTIELKRMVDIGSFGKDGKSYVGFWLYDTGCTPVNLTAQIAGQSPAPVVKKTIGFKCGE
jgi:hypothetical protein